MLLPPGTTILQKTKLLIWLMGHKPCILPAIAALFATLATAGVFHRRFFLTSAGEDVG